PGPASIPRMRSTVDHQARAASTKSRTTSPTRARAARSAGAIPASARPSCGEAITFSGHPGELGLGDARLPFVPASEGLDARPLRLGSAQPRSPGTQRPSPPDRVACLHSEGNDVFDLEVDRVADLDAVAHTVLVDLDRGTLDAEHVAHEGGQRFHGAAL